MRRSLNMLPGFAANHVADRPPSHSESLGEFLIREPRVKRSDFANLILGQPGVAIALAFVRSATSFLRHIPVVFRFGPQEEMLRIYATRIVAFVQNTLISRIFFAAEIPRKPVSVLLLSINFELPVASLISSSHPHPTLSKFWTPGQHRPVFLVDVLPKTILPTFHAGKFTQFTKLTGRSDELLKEAA